ncbi:hypothetical protein RND61_11940 [Streptomyces sp. TRM76323]|uniref:Uncharacterized protein n=1 Tax=Streptomyces tamarix TaxID=3078565 RepID=A0ABU3QJ13_9ACTN|nr:hypothetical protein [Streptomyces tamarix]MDT9682775.1 hypothetical protein [Streptomyces tamarix]
MEQLRALMADFAPVVPPGAPMVLNARYGLVLNLLHAGRSAEAEAEVAVLVEALGPEGPATAGRSEETAALRQRVAVLTEQLDRAR